MIKLNTKNEIIKIWQESSHEQNELPTCPHCRDNLGVAEDKLYCENFMCTNINMYSKERDKNGCHKFIRTLDKQEQMIYGKDY